MNPIEKRHGLSALVVLAALLLPAPARAQEDTSVQSEAQAAIDEARRLYVELEFVGAIEVLGRTLATPGLPDALRAAALETRAAACVVLDREACARDALAELFRLDPYYVVREPSGSPRIQRFVEAVREREVPDAAMVAGLELRAELPRTARGGAELRVTVGVAGPDGVDALTIFYRSDTETRWQQAEARDDDGWSARIAVPADGLQLELYAQARDAQGRVSSRLAGPLSPLRLPIESRASGGGDDTPVLESWWLWTAIGGGVAIAVAIALGVALSGPSQASPGTLGPGRVELPLLRF